MINLPSDFANARAFDGNQLPQLTPGGHICQTRNVKLTKSKTGKDMLLVYFDINEHGDFDGYYRALYERMGKYNPDAPFPGVFRVTIATNDGKTNGYFKGLINAIQDSNPGFTFNGDETQLGGKWLGLVFGEEEYAYTDRQSGQSKVRTSCKPQYAVSVSRIRDGVSIPIKKTLSPSERPSAAAQGFTEITDDELPF